jgi:hypothetical protein
MSYSVEILKMKTREEWLVSAIDLMKKEFFNKPNRALPKVAVSCGIPKGSSKAIGQCWDPIASTDGTTHIFVCPSQECPITVLGILLHELIHACVGIPEGHTGQFASMARQVGLKGKLTATFVEKNSTLFDQLHKMVSHLGEYPHKAMKKSVSSKKKRVVRKKYAKLVSTQDPDYFVKIEVSLLEIGIPKDPWGNELELA